MPNSNDLQPIYSPIIELSEDEKEQMPPILERPVLVRQRAIRYIPIPAPAPIPP